jgi:large subunit ribosomal protein L21
MYAVIESGGKQYRVELGTELAVDRLLAEPGQTIELSRVLLVADGDEAAIGQPLVSGATVSAQVVRQERGDKLVVFKYKPKARRRVKHGFRSELTVLRIADIAWDGRSAAKEHAKVVAAEKREAEAAEKQARAKAEADRELAEKLATAAAAAQAEEQAAKPKSRRSRAAAPRAAAAAPDPSAPTPEAAETPDEAAQTSDEAAVSAETAEAVAEMSTVAPDASDDQATADEPADGESPAEEDPQTSSRQPGKDE